MTDELLCVHMIWDDACGEEAGAEIHQDRARWNYHPFEAAPSTDERLCSVCGHGRYEDPRHGTCNHQTDGESVVCACHRFSPLEAAPSTELEMCPSCGHTAHLAGECPSEMTGPYAECDCGYEPALPEAAHSTDEGEARWERNRVFDSSSYSWWDRPGQSYQVPLSLESAIAAEARAPLEERIRELKAELSGTVETYVETTGDMGSEILELRAENERLREALREIATMGGGDVMALRERMARIANGALATPPSSTEGTPSASRVISGRIIREGTKEVEG